MLDLIAPTAHLRSSWLEAFREWPLDGFLLEASGHIGYSVRPSARRRGVATRALAALLPRARALGLDRTLLTCEEDNTGSARTIERNGGVLEDVRSGAYGTRRRYRIDLDGPGRDR
ncbi:GNAT family N-acetyltransferase [Streptomyces sp. NPDC093249]|uniref:GNAT family N-acetyltransferase n=1 Tax=unclassified Streptomyces TaxID=2593676 RepID=UPI0038012BCC